MTGFLNPIKKFPPIGMQWLFLALVAVNVVALTYAQADYIVCAKEIEYNPGVCDCRGHECLIELKITYNLTTDRFSVNGERMAPTIIVNYDEIVVVDVFNNMDITDFDGITLGNSNISMHWHGMHQKNTAWMDGVGMITQWPTPPGESFR